MKTGRNPHLLSETKQPSTDGPARQGVMQNTDVPTKKPSPQPLDTGTKGSRGK